MWIGKNNTINKQNDKEIKDNGEFHVTPKFLKARGPQGPVFEKKLFKNMV